MYDVIFEPPKTRSWVFLCLWVTVCLYTCLPNKHGLPYVIKERKEWLFFMLINVRTSSLSEEGGSQLGKHICILEFFSLLTSLQKLTLYFPGFIFFHCVNMDLHPRKNKIAARSFRTNLNIGKMIRSSAVPVLGICYEKVCVSPLSSFINSVMDLNENDS